LNRDLQRQFDTATAFFLAGERCALELRFGQYEFHSLSAPTIVNYAFAVELALKLIHSLASNVAVTGHNLEKIFHLLPGDVRSRLPHLSDCVEEIAQYFEKWRYPFEKEILYGDYENPRRAFIECYQEIRRLRPQLKSVYESGWGSFEPEWILSWQTDHPRWELKSAGA